ncbi:type III secretion system apparatus protein VscT2 [Vibrio coralliilyticus]|uniref:type III secretion system apparatus protein VscT2 n=1 Tax=Vibrio coralliilyticus TaxID=190893 RepID=UPI0017F0AE0C|nr:type III secretion system apparatus protein VscT2 [Vibrio coralliilyticus]NUW68080.1 type III secretion system apparatus protein VscT2 [Vibrio coralliilyticus]
MEGLYFPNWIIFAGFFLFLRLYNPTRLYLDNTTSLGISVVLAIYIDSDMFLSWNAMVWVLSIIGYALIVSVPYMLGGMVGSIIQQLLLLNEQAVQDKRFTEESEALSKMSSLILLFYSLEGGLLFQPLLFLMDESGDNILFPDFYEVYQYVVSALKTSAIVSGKYIVSMLCVVICVGCVDLFFKKASLSVPLTPNVQSILVVTLVNLWLFDDQFYLYEKLIEGYPW